MNAEELKLNNLETEVECDVDHDTVQGSHLEKDGWTDVDTNYCPKCGEEL